MKQDSMDALHSFVVVVDYFVCFLHEWAIVLTPCAFAGLHQLDNLFYRNGTLIIDTSSFFQQQLKIRIRQSIIWAPNIDEDLVEWIDFDGRRRWSAKSLDEFLLETRWTFTRVAKGGRKRGRVRQVGCERSHFVFVEQMMKHQGGMHVSNSLLLTVLLKDALEPLCRFARWEGSDGGRTSECHADGCGDEHDDLLFGLLVKLIYVRNNKVTEVVNGWNTICDKKVNEKNGITVCPLRYSQIKWWSALLLFFSSCKLRLPISGGTFSWRETSLQLFVWIIGTVRHFCEVTTVSSIAKCFQNICFYTDAMIISKHELCSLLRRDWDTRTCSQNSGKTSFSIRIHWFCYQLLHFWKGKVALTKTWIRNK